MDLRPPTPGEVMVLTLLERNSDHAATSWSSRLERRSIMLVFRILDQAGGEFFRTLDQG
jgi:hypothetical protein